VAYFTTSDINGWMPASDAVVSGEQTKVDAWCLLICSAIDVARRKAGLTAPSTDADEINLYKLRGSREGAYQVKASRGAATGDKISPLYLGWHKEFEDMVLQQSQGKLVIPTGQTGEPWSWTRDADPSDMSDDRNPLFIRDYTP
jgi:hypothetical protein